MNKTITLHEPHPIFTQAENRSLFLASDDIERLHQFQQHSLRHEPSDLRRHVQFIFSLMRQVSVKREDLFAALVDLFIVLNHHGFALRQRMIDAAKPFLLDEDCHFFQQHLQSGLSAKTPLPISCPSILTEAYTGRADHIKKHIIKPTAQHISEHEQALDFIEQGDLESAIHLLQELLYQRPSNEQIAEDLINTLRHAEQEQKLAEIQHWFIENNLPLPNCWPLF